MALPTIDYDALERVRTTEIQDEISEKLISHQSKDYSRPDSLRSAVLNQVASNSYDIAVKELYLYVEMRDEYPLFQDRVQRYLSHCKDLIHAIDTKRNFPGLGALSLSKQQELYEKVLDHFEELKDTLKQIEGVERDVQLADVRSTVGFMKAVVNASFFVIVIGFCLEVMNGLGTSLHNVINDMTKSLTEFIFSLF